MAWYVYDIDIDRVRVQFWLQWPSVHLKKHGDFIAEWNEREKIILKIPLFVYKNICSRTKVAGIKWNLNAIAGKTSA